MEERTKTKNKKFSKKVLGFGLIILIGILIASYYFFFSSYDPNKEFEQLLLDYSEALFLLTAVSTVDSESVDFDTWHQWVKENLDQWETISQRVEALNSYLEKKPNQLTLLEQRFVYAQNEEVEIAPSSEELRDIFRESIRIRADQAPKGEKVKTIMKELGLSAKEAQDLLQEAYQADRQKWEDKAKRAELFYKLSKGTKEFSFFVVSVGSVVVGAGEVATATSLLAKGYGILAVSFAGADVVLAVGEKGAQIINNKKGKTIFVEAREKIGKVNAVFAFVDLKKGLKEASNLVTLEGYAEAVAKIVKENMASDSVLHLELSQYENEVRLGADLDPETFQAVFSENETEELSKGLDLIFPPGTFNIGGEKITVIEKKEKTEESEINKGDIFSDFCYVFTRMFRVYELVGRKGELQPLEEINLDLSSFSRCMETIPIAMEKRCQEVCSQEEAPANCKSECPQYFKQALKNMLVPYPYKNAKEAGEGIYQECQEVCKSASDKKKRGCGVICEELRSFYQTDFSQ